MDLFDKWSDNDIKPLSHRDDPATSKQAIAEMVSTGSRGRHMEAVLKAVRENEGSTATELMKASGLEEYQIRRRLTDLKNNNFVIRGDARTCRVKGSKMCTWKLNRELQYE